jgi:amino acid adenylation domain-containing protein
MHKNSMDVMTQLLEVPIGQERQQKQPLDETGGAATQTYPLDLSQVQDEVYAMPATQGQVRFWSLDQLNPGNPALNMPLMWQCTGILDLPALHEAFAQCVQRHEILRTTFEWMNGKLAQIIHPDMSPLIPLVDLTALTGESQCLESDRVTRSHAAYRFDLKRGPLLALKLLRLGEQHHLLLVTMHHIVCDGISNGILMRDMVAWYKALVNHTVPQLPKLSIQFADYAIWHEEWRAGEEPAASFDFWRETLGNEFTPIRLQHDPDARAALSPEGAALTGDIETLLIPPDLASRAHAFCIRENVTFNILLFSVFSALLSRLTGQRDLAIGSPCANRTEDTQELIGLFMNIQLLRVKLDDDSTFRQLLRQVQAWTLGAYENQVLPFEDLVYDPFFSQGGSSFEIPVFFLYQKSFMLTGQIHSEAGHLEIVPLRSESPGAVFDVMFAIVDREEEGPRLQLEYNPQFFKAITIQRYLRSYLNVLEAAVSAPDCLVDQLSMVSASEHARLIVDPNRTRVDFGEFASVDQIFLKRAKEFPDHLAAECDGKCWTNEQLAEYARSLAVRLVAEGMKPGDLAAICVDRSLKMLGCLLAVLIAGGAYTPLDPTNPRERLESILADSGAAFLLTDQTLPLTSEARILQIKGGSAEVVGVSTRRSISPPPHSNSLAYVIYTSGSTGKPKGVAIEHGALTNLLLSIQREPGLGPADVLVAITTLAFDIAALELLLPLITGARLVIATRSQAKNPVKLLTLLRERGATVLQATPGAWRALIDAGWSGSPPLKALCGGELLSRELADQLLDRSPSVWNMYGPTETTIWSSATLVKRGPGTPRLGTPIANTQFYVLDKSHEPTSAGMDGELYIGGAGLARGYWNNPELTSALFLPSPFGPGRIYRTGDLARRHEDGTVQLLGRSDFQVKIRGYRIELGEIEAALRKHPLVREAVVLQSPTAPEGQESSTGDAPVQLIAYIEAGTAADPKNSPDLISELSSAVGRSLPDYMRPSAIFAVSELPRNTNGKIDRKALPRFVDQTADAAASTSGSVTENYFEPADLVEQQITELWQSTLGILKISVRASFFSLGVSSLAALRLITRMNRAYAMDLGLASLISASTIESIAALIRDRFAPNTASSLVPIQPAGNQPPLFIVHGVGGNVVNFYGLSMRIGENQPVYGVQAQALLANQPALLRLEDMAAYYLAEIRKVQPRGPYKFLGYSFGGTVALEMAHQLHEAGEAVVFLGMLDAKTLEYEEQLARTRSVQAKIEDRVNRFRGNTGQLDLKSRLSYVYDKVSTRAIRYGCMLLSFVHVKKVPSFMKSAYDINYVALRNHKVRPYGGRLILFRANEQEFMDGAFDLGWGAIFRDGVEVRELPGDHDRIFLEPNIDVLASSLRACLRNE